MQYDHPKYEAAAATMARGREASYEERIEAVGEILSSLIAERPQLEDDYSGWQQHLEDGDWSTPPSLEQLLAMVDDINAQDEAQND